MSVVELQDIAENVSATYSGKQWWFSAAVRSAPLVIAGVAHSRDPDFLVAATKLICEAKRMREAAR